MARSFVMQLASLVTLFVSIPAFITLVFSIINLQFPDAAEAYWQMESAESSIRYSIAVLVIFFPAYLYLTRKVNEARRGEGELYHTLTKWVIYLGLLIAGIVILTDLAVVVYTFLNGELTTRFILKALALLAVMSGVVYYYAMDAKDYWQKRERDSISIGIGALVVVLLAVVYGYSMIDAPSVTREVRLDQQQVSDLQDMQWRIESYHQTNSSFPADLEMVYEDFPVPVAPEGRADYEYKITGSDTFKLCATFSEATPSSERSMAKPYGGSEGIYLENQNWEHGTGEKCFERRIIPLQ